MIGDFIGAVTPGNRFRFTDETKRQLEVLKAIAWEWMIEDPAQETVRFGQRRLVEDLFSGYWENPLMLSNRGDWADLRHSVGGKKLDRPIWSEKARLICDEVSGMTDLFALHAHSEMYGGGGAPNLRLL